MVAEKLDVAVTDDFDLDDIESMPKFVNLPTGGYVLCFEKGVEDKTVNEGQEKAFLAAEAKAKIISVAEVDTKSLEVGEEPPKEGDEATFLFNRESKWGADGYKEFLLPIRNHFFPGQSGITIGQIKEKIVGLTVVALIQRRYGKDSDGKKDPEKKFMKIMKMEVV